MGIFVIAKREIKLGFRNSWTYSFLILLTLFTLVTFLLQTGISTSEGFTNLIGTVMNMTLYLLPLTTLLLGGFSITAEKENGQWGLLSTYPISNIHFFIGKWLGLIVVVCTIIFFSFGLTGIISLIFRKTFDFDAFVFLILFSVCLALAYMSIALLIGAIAKNRWQSLIGGISVWFITIVIWPMLMISTLSHLPSYQLIQPLLQGLTLVNPAEMIRIFFVMYLNAGSMFGANYYQWIRWATSVYGIWLFIGIFFIWNLVLLSVSGFIWTRGDKNDRK